MKQSARLTKSITHLLGRVVYLETRIWDFKPVKNPYLETTGPRQIEVCSAMFKKVCGIRGKTMARYKRQICDGSRKSRGWPVCVRGGSGAVERSRTVSGRYGLSSKVRIVHKFGRILFWASRATQDQPTSALCS